jgi:subtilisin family serine protease
MRSLIIAAALATASGKILKSHNAELIENEFIVVLKANATKADRENHIALLGDAKVLYTYDNVFTGYAVQASELDMERISEHPDVDYVEQNGVVRAYQECLHGPINPPPSAGLWGLSRVSYRNIQSPVAPVRYRPEVGATIYILDTGINYAHTTFAGRAVFGFDATGEGPNDGNGHGTHCAGTAGGVDHGISKAARIVDVKVLGRTGGGSFAGVAAGIDWVAGPQNPNPGPRVASLSLGGGVNQAVNDAVNRLDAAGGFVSVASGNGNANACNSSPASATGAYTVNAIANNDARAAFSNWGTCTQIFAPGQNVLSAWIGSTSATNTISGTSMACPHVTGIASDLWGSRGWATPGREIKERVTALALRDRVTNPGTGSPNLLAQGECALPQN